MAHTGARAQEFLEDLKAKTERRFQRGEPRNCWSSAAPSKARTRPSSRPGTSAYYAEKQRAALYDFDEEALRPYFPLERVVAGMFEIVGRLYGIRVAEQTGVPGLGSAGAILRRSATKTATFLGGFYADWYPRENKRGGAWMDCADHRRSAPPTASSRTWA